MRKFLLTVLAIACVLCLSIALVACSEEEEQHEFGEWINEVAPTCTDVGTVGHFHCSHCNKDFDAQYNELTSVEIAALDHDWKEEVTKEATCTEKGSKTVSCSRCGTVSSVEEIDFIAHDYDGWTVTRGATCTVAGEQMRTCQTCGHVDLQSIDCVAHTGIIVLGAKPTCTENGASDCYVCSMCGKYSATENGDYIYTLKEDVQTVIPSTGHDYEGQQWVTLQEATCQQQGQRERKCANCSEPQVETVQKADHSYGDWVIETAATCTKPGLEKRTCQTCDSEIGEPAFETQALPVDETAHTAIPVEGKEATCIEAGLTNGSVCSECGTELVKQTPIDPLQHQGEFTYQHVESDQFEHHIMKCSRPNCPGEEVQCDIQVTEERTYCDVEGTSTRSCTKCGYSKTTTLAAGEHSWDAGQITVPAKCNSDGVMTYTCEHCKKTQTNTITLRPPHVTDGEWKVEDGKHFHLCTQCNERLDEDDHTPSQGWKTDGTNHWHECEVCHGATGLAAHSEQTLDEVQPSCEVAGKTEGSFCPVCQYVLREQTEIPAKQHEYGPWQQDASRVGEHKAVCNNCQEETWQQCVYTEKTVDATCTDAGYKYNFCSECGGEVKTQDIDALGHNYDIWTPLTVNESEIHAHYHVSQCTRCFEQTKEECDLQQESEVQADCTTPHYIKQVCQKCQVVHEEILAPANGHQIEYEHKIITLFECEHREYCVNCDYGKDFEPCKPEISYTQATCTDDRKVHYLCAVCHLGRTIPEAGTALGHSMSQPEFCGDAQNPRHRIYCTRDDCDEEQFFACTPGTTTTQPTCEAAGSVKTFCTVCLGAISEGSIESVGHKWTQWEISDGEHSRRCTACGAKDSSAHDWEEVSRTEADCEQLGILVQRCTECHKQQTTTWGEIKKHQWVVDSISADKHVAQCIACHKRDELNHDWSDSNICSVCGVDGLEYRIEGAHCYVINDNKVPNAKNIVIERTHKVLQADGTYEPTEYVVKEISNNAFANNRTIQTLSFPSSVERIGDMAFYYCTGLRNVTVTGDEDALKTIANWAFTGCGALTDFRPPKSLVSIGDYAFLNCTTLADIEVGDHIEVIGKSAFLNTAFVNNPEHWTDDALYIGKYLIKVHQTEQADGSLSNTEVTVRPDTMTISAEAFSTCPKLSGLILPASLQTVDVDAFKNCTEITYVEFQGDFEEWLNIHFANDYASPLHNGSPAFHIDMASDVIDIPDGVTRIPAGTFRGTTITKVTIPQSVVYIGEEAFENCTQLEKIIVNSSKINYIGKDAFTGSKFYLAAENWDDRGVLYVGDKYLVAAKTTLSGSYTVADGTLGIANGAFKGCKQLNELTLNKELLFVGEGAFEGCDGMRKIVFTETGYYWFMNGVIGRAIQVYDTNWSHYKIYYGSWRRYDK